MAKGKESKPIAVICSRCGKFKHFELGAFAPLFDLRELEERTCRCENGSIFKMGEYI